MSTARRKNAKRRKDLLQGTTARHIRAERQRVALLKQAYNNRKNP